MLSIVRTGPSPRCWTATSRSTEGRPEAATAAWNLTAGALFHTGAARGRCAAPLSLRSVPMTLHNHGNTGQMKTTASARAKTTEEGGGGGPHEDAGQEGRGHAGTQDHSAAR